MFNRVKKPAVQAPASQLDKQTNSQAVALQPIELTVKEISSMMQFGSYYSGCSPEWELFH